MSPRLSTGELERKVLDVLWSADGPMTPRQVHDVLASERDLAYTTIMTILVRLWQKGIVSRERDGRAFAYAPHDSREEHVAARMREVLAAASDANAALGHFVRDLDTKKRSQLRRLLGGSGR